MGIGQALSEGMQLDEYGRQLNPHLLDYKLVTAADAPPIEIAWVQTFAANGGPNGSKGIGEPPLRPDARRGRQRDREGDRPKGVPAADDARAGLGGERDEPFTAGRIDHRGRHRRARGGRSPGRGWNRPGRRGTPGQIAAA